MPYDDYHPDEPPNVIGSSYRVFRAFGDNCWRRVLPLIDHPTLEDAIREADEKLRNYEFADEVTFTVSTYRDGPELYRTSRPALSVDAQ